MDGRPIASMDLEHVLAGTRDLWEEMRGERLFITGGTGFFGCWLMETFCFANAVLKLGAHAVVLTRSAGAFRKKMPHVTRDGSVTLLEDDVCSFSYPEGKFRFAIHAANEAAGNTAEQFSRLIAGTERVLRFAEMHGTRKLLYTSSGAVYGKQPDGLTHVPETYLGAVDSLDPRSMYAEGKRASELMCALAGSSSELECKIARCWAFCGPHLPLDTNFAIGNFIGDAIRRQPIRISGDGTARRSYLYAADLCIWLWTVLFKAPALIPINVGSAQDLSIREVAETVAQSLGSQAEIQIALKPVPGVEPSRYVPSIKRAAELLGLRQHIGLHEMIRRTADWYEGY